MNAAYIFLIVVGIIVLWIVFSFNGLVRRKNRVDEAWADIEVQLKRRYDLIPNLMETVKGYAFHEKTLLENITKERAEAINTSDPQKKLEANNMLSDTLKTLFAVSENYPELRANQNFLKLQDELTDTEDKIQAARRFYNANVRDFNTALEIFPTNIIAKIFGFSKKELFDVDKPEERENVKVKF